MPRRQWLFIAAMLLVIAAIMTCERSFRVPNRPRADQAADHSTRHGAPSRKGNWVFEWTFEHPDTFFSGVVAVFTVILATSTTLLWIETLRSGRRQREEMAAAQRAFVFIDGFNTELTTVADGTLNAADILKLPAYYRSHPELFVTRFAAQPRWKNSGSTPTKNMSFQVNWAGPPTTIPPEYDYRAESIPFFIAPNAVEVSEFVEITGTQVIIDNMLEGLPYEPMFFIWGRADYDDVFGERHFVEWCYRLRYERHRDQRMTASFIQWGEYNRSDEDA